MVFPRQTAIKTTSGHTIAEFLEISSAENRRRAHQALAYSLGRPGFQRFQQNDPIDPVEGTSTSFPSKTSVAGANTVYRCKTCARALKLPFKIQQNNHKMRCEVFFPLCSKQHNGRIMCKLCKKTYADYWNAYIHLSTYHYKVRGVRQYL